MRVWVVTVVTHYGDDMEISVFRTLKSAQVFADIERARLGLAEGSYVWVIRKDVRE